MSWRPGTPAENTSCLSVPSQVCCDKIYVFELWCVVQKVKSNCQLDEIKCEPWSIGNNKGRQGRLSVSRLLGHPQASVIWGICPQHTGESREIPTSKINWKSFNSGKFRIRHVEQHSTDWDVILRTPWIKAIPLKHIRIKRDTPVLTTSMRMAWLTRAAPHGQKISVTGAWIWVPVARHNIVVPA